MGRETHRQGKDGIREDDVRVYPADAHDMATYEHGRQALSELRPPTFLQASNPHDRIFVVAFDGTWNDAQADPDHMTNVGIFRKQILGFNENGDNDIKVGYVEGVGTQGNPLVKLFDGAIGYTYDQRLEEMYEKLIRQAYIWIKEDPSSQLRIADIGFSRGAEQAAGFTRLVHDRGIQDPSGAATRRDISGRTVIEHTKPPLVPPGQIAQAVGLFDPVGTGEPRNHDRRLPPSVISGFQIKAEDERRGLFKSTSIIDQGITIDGRFLGVTVSGAHSDIGGGYHRNGLSIRSGNLMVDYLNSLSDTPFLQKLAEPAMQGMNVVHRSEEATLLFRMWREVDRLGPDGVVETLAPWHVCRIVVDCRNAEPRDETLAAGFDYVRVRIGPVPADSIRLNPPVPVDATTPGHPDHALLLQAMSAVDRLETRLGRSRDINSDRLATCAVAAARQEGLASIDHVVLSDKGEFAFVVQGDLDSPLKRYARIETGTAIHTPVGLGLDRIDAINEEQALGYARQQAQHQQATLQQSSVQEHARAHALSR